MDRLYGGIEAGGTKFLCVVANSQMEIVAEERISTTTPELTLSTAIDFFCGFSKRGELAGVGIGAFGPLDLDPRSPAYGSITSTPKPGWSGVDLLGEFKRGLGIPVALDTDVNAAAMGELGGVAQNRGMDPFLYMTVGTGIGVGVVVHGKPVHGLVHPEAGHTFIPHSWKEDPFPGICPYHGDCLEGLTSGPALRKRWGVPPEELSGDHPAWDLEARYLALGISNLILCLSPQRIVLGGGVLQQPGLIDKVRQATSQVLNGYIQSDWLAGRMDRFIVSPHLSWRSGVLGAVMMAVEKFSQHSINSVEQGEGQ
jgi:fructokinase